MGTWETNERWKHKLCWSVFVGGAEVSPGGVHASTEDWTSTERLLEGMGIFLSLYFAKAAWTASVCRSKETHPLSQTYEIGALKLQIFWILRTRSEALIPGIGSPGLVLFGNWNNGLRGSRDSVVDLQRWIYACREKRTTAGGEPFRGKKDKTSFVV